MKDKFRRILVWSRLTEKRLLKKKSYLLTIMLVPVLLLGLRIVSGEDKGILTVGLYAESEFAAQIADELENAGTLLKFVRYNSAEDAQEAVKNGTVNTAWILPDNLESKMNNAARKGSAYHIVTVVEREDDISQIFAREILCSKLFPKYIYGLYCEFVRKRIDPDISEEELFEKYHVIEEKTELFQAEYPNGMISADADYLVAPVRGMLAVWLVLSCFGAVLYYKRDEEQGVYDVYSSQKRFACLLGTQFFVALNGCIICILSCKICNIALNLLHEIALWGLLAGCSICFCTILTMILGKPERICMVTVLSVIMMLVFCPVFMELGPEWSFKWVFPPYFYLKALYSSYYAGRMGSYIAIGCAIIFMIRFAFKRQTIR